MELRETLIEKKTIYRGRILSLNSDIVRLPDGNTAYREHIEHSGGAAVLAINSNNEIYLIKQYRYPYDEILLEIPAGKIMKGELPIECARRELEEETGLISDNLILINTIYPSPGYTNERLYIYLSYNPIEGEAKPDPDEYVERVKIEFEEALKMVTRGEILDGKTVIAIYSYALKMKGLIQ